MTLTLAESYAWCRDLSRRTGRNFYYSFLTLPPAQQRDMCVLYAFMRRSDDIGDDLQLPIEARRTELSAWRRQLAWALDGARFEHPLLPALADIVRRYQLPPEYLVAVIDGVEMDLRPQRFETFSELQNYCYHVAGAVGLCCIHLWGFRDDRARQHAIDCGTAFQLTNILRDLSEDAAMGRCYLPQEDLRQFGYTEADILQQCRDERFENLMRFAVDRTRDYYRRAKELTSFLLPAGRPIYTAMLRIYGGLLDEIERSRFDVFSRRISLPAWKKLFISFDAVLRQRLLTRLLG